MRRLAFLLIVAAPLAVCQAPTLPGVPVTQERHHHLVLENAFVRAFEVEVAPHESTLMHQHVHDYVYIVFGDADITNAVADKPEVSLKQPDLAVNFSRGPFAHIARNNAVTPFRNITIELLRPQGEVRKPYTSVREALAASDGKGSHEAAVLETDDVRVSAIGVPAQATWIAPADGRNRLIVLLDKIHDTGPKEKNAPFPAGMLRWQSAGQELRLPNTSLGEMKLLVLEFKDK